MLIYDKHVPSLSIIFGVHILSMINDQSILSIIYDTTFMSNFYIFDKCLKSSTFLLQTDQE
jgi:hypothetical protein